MARLSQRRMMDSYQKSIAKGAKPSSVSIISGGIKYKAGNLPARVCPVGSVRSLTLAQPV